MVLKRSTRHFPPFDIARKLVGIALWFHYANPDTKKMNATVFLRRCLFLYGAWLSHSAYDARMAAGIVFESVNLDMPDLSVTLSYYRRLFCWLWNQTWWCCNLFWQISYPVDGKRFICILCIRIEQVIIIHILILLRSRTRRKQSFKIREEYCTNASDTKNGFQLR